MHQRLNCYKILVDVAKEMPSLISCIPRGDGYLMDQIKRALTSSILNLCEGNGRYSTKERNKFFNYSLGSISEVMGAIEIVLAYDYIQDEYARRLLNNLRKAYYMIRKLKR